MEIHGTLEIGNEKINMKGIFTLIILIFLYCSNYAFAQSNYVPNGNFEIIDTCPNPNIQPYRSIYYAKPWFQPFLGGNSSDLFNICDTFNNSLGVPNNWYGYQMAQDGFGYAGILLGSDGMDVREYLEVELQNSMQAGRDYCISLYISLSEYGRYAIDQIQGHLSSNPIYYSTPSWGLLQLTPDFRSPIGTVLIDTVNWIHITDTYTSVGGERYLTIGNFTPDSNLTHIIKKPSDPPFAYYYIDNIEIYDCDSITGLNYLADPLSLVIGPNPVDDIINIEFKGNGNSYVEIFNLSGQKVKEQLLKPAFSISKVEVDISDLSKGLYLLKLSSGPYVETRKIILE